MTSVKVVCEETCDNQEKTVNARNDVVFRNEEGNLEVTECPTCEGKAHIKGEDEEVDSQDQDSGQEEETTEVSVEVESREDLEELSWEDLKEVAGEYGVKRNQSREEITDQLVQAIGLE